MAGQCELVGWLELVGQCESFRGVNWLNSVN